MQYNITKYDIPKYTIYLLYRYYEQFRGPGNKNPGFGVVLGLALLTSRPLLLESTFGDCMGGGVSSLEIMGATGLFSYGSTLVSGSKLVSEREEGILQCKLHAHHIPAAKPPSVDADVLLMLNKPPDMFRSFAKMAPPAEQSQIAMQERIFLGEVGRLHMKKLPKTT